MASEDCDLTEAELLALLKGINSDTIKEKTQNELNEKYGGHVSSVEATRRGVKNDNQKGETDESKADADWTTPEGFLAAAPEIANMNQYWYSLPTINKMVSVIRECSKRADGNPMRVAFISTPSLFFSFTEEERKDCVVLDYDRQWADVHGFHFYDFNDPEVIPEQLKGQFDVIVIDPPFIQEACWRQYGITGNLLLKNPPSAASTTNTLEDAEQLSDNMLENEGGRTILTTVLENEHLLFELFPGTKPNVFRPSIPNLVYQ
mmetsp:Transcript_16178/g.19150  ORF Transcript_16178/g.19150 Transcript_16178/m.19150 type:complete len:262 (-) Transcript_16178:133-918(-)